MGSSVESLVTVSKHAPMQAYQKVAISLSNIRTNNEGFMIGPLKFLQDGLGTSCMTFKAIASKKALI
jgi:hypothetical protein